LEQPKSALSKAFFAARLLQKPKNTVPLPIKGALSLAYTPLLIPPPAQELKKAQPPGRTFSFLIIYLPPSPAATAWRQFWMFDVGRWMLDVF